MRLLFASLATLAIVMSCSPTRDITNNKSANEQQEYLKLHEISWLETLNQKENHYIIFVYSITCGYCHEMMDEIIDFAKCDILETYFINTENSEVPINAETKEYITEIEELSIIGTPTILEIENKIVINNIAGIDKCLSFLIDKRMT